MDAFDALDDAHGCFRRRLAAVRVSHLSLPTPCAERNVRDLLNHVLGSQRRHLMVLNGASTAAVEATRQHLVFSQDGYLPDATCLTYALQATATVSDAIRMSRPD